MTLIVHFRTEKYAVVAADTMSINDENEVSYDAQKVFYLKDEGVVGIMGLTSKILIKYLTESHRSEQEIIEFIKQNPIIPYAGSNDKYLCLLFVYNGYSLLHLINLIAKNTKIIHFNIESEFEIPTGIMSLQEQLNLLAKNKVFFGDPPISQSIDLDFQHSYKKCFEKLVKEVLDEKSFDIEKVSNIKQVEELVGDFFSKCIVKSGVGGYVRIAIIDIETGNITNEEYQQYKVSKQEIVPPSNGILDFGDEIPDFLQVNRTSEILEGENL